jgi:phage tail-like protein
MATLSEQPYAPYNFLVSLGGGDPQAVVAGFSEASGLGVEIVYAEYRNGNDKTSAPRKIPGLHKFSDVTLKRGFIGASDLFDWLKHVASGVPDARNVTIDLLDAARQPVARWILHRAQPRKWSGPTLVADGAGHVAIEELVLVHEGIEMQ